MPIDNFIETLIDEIDGKIRFANIGGMQDGKIVLGGVAGPNGGSGSPPGNFVGQLNQRFVTYDTTEAATIITASSSSLVDNLNHIRHDIENLIAVSGMDATAIHTNADSEIYTITLKTTPVNNDVLLIEDSEDSYNKKRILASGILGGGSGADENAIHVDEASEIYAVTLKATPANNDVLLIEDSADSYSKKRILVSGVLGGGGSGNDDDAVHVDVASEIYGVSEKSYFDDTDVVLIEDSDDSYNKKRVQISNVAGIINLSDLGGVSIVDPSNGDILEVDGEGSWINTSRLYNSADEITATSAGVAASVDTAITEVTTNGDSDLDNVTLANGLTTQIKHIFCVAEGNASDTWKITPANMIGGTQITFAGAGEGCTLVYADSEGWCVIGNNGGTIS